MTLTDSADGSAAPVSKFGFANYVGVPLSVNSLATAKNTENPAEGEAGLAKRRAYFQYQRDYYTEEETRFSHANYNENNFPVDFLETVVTREGIMMWRGPPSRDSFSKSFNSSTTGEKKNQKKKNNNKSHEKSGQNLAKSFSVSSLVVVILLQILCFFS